MAETVYLISDFKGVDQVFFSLIPRNIAKLTLVDCIKEYI